MKDKVIHVSRDVKFNEGVFVGTNNQSSFGEINIDEIENIRIVESVYHVERAPDTVEEARKSKDWQKWKKAMEEELRSMQYYETWELVARPQCKQVFSNKWVFARKSDGRFKARLVLRGCEEEDVIDPYSVHAPVAKIITLRTLLVVGCKRRHYSRHVDIGNAFLNAPLDEVLYMEPPEGLSMSQGLVCRVKKAMYGHPKAPKAWNERIHEFLVGLGFRQSENDKCLYIMGNDEDAVYLLLYVDDMFLSCRNSRKLEEVVEKLSKEFKVKDMGQVSKFLGLRIDYKQEKGYLSIDQEELILKIANRFCLDNIKSTNVPMEKGLVCEINEDPKCSTKLPYKELFGCLMYIMIGSRPDICYAISFFGTFQSNPTEEQFKYLLRVLKYLYCTSSKRLVFNPNDDELIGYADADWANCMNSRKSISGWCFKLYDCLISWSSKKQQLVALSSTEAELISLSNCVCDVLWLIRLLADLGMSFNKPVVINEDNEGVLKLVKDPRNNGQRTKHIDVKYFFVRDIISKNIINVKYCESRKQLADVFTKSLSKVRFNEFLNMMNLY